MTCILAIQNPKTGEAAIGCDGRTSAGNSVISGTTVKLTELNVGILGLAGESAVQETVRRALRNGVAQPEHAEDVGAWVLDLLRGAGWKFNENLGESPDAKFSGVFVSHPNDVHERPRVFDLCGSGSMVAVEAAMPAARGSGGTLSIGAAMAFIRAEHEWCPYLVVLKALSVACALDTSCGGLITVLRVPIKVREGNHEAEIL